MTAYSNTYKSDRKSYKKLDNNIKEYKFSIKAQSITNLMLKFENISNNTTFSIKSISIDTVYLPVLNLDISNLKKQYNSNQTIKLDAISRILVIIPMIIFIIALFALLYISRKEIKYLFDKKLSFLKSYQGILFILGIIVFICFYEYVRYSSLPSNVYWEIKDNNDVKSMFIVILQFLKNDVRIICLFILLFFITIKSKNKFITFTSILFISILIYIIYFDIYLIVSFKERFTFALLLEKSLIPDNKSLWTILSGFFHQDISIKMISLLVYLICFIVFILKYKNRIIMTKVQSYFILIMIAAILPFYFIDDFFKLYNGADNQKFSDIISANTRETFNHEYSAQFKEKYKNYSLEYQCYDGLNTKKNVIIVFIESLSSYKSKFFGNIGENRTPFVDSIGKENINLSEYYGNSGNSSQNIMLFLTGKHYLYPDSLLKESLYNDSIPSHFANNGYNTILYSGADVIYGSTSDIARKAGIQTIYDTKLNDVFLQKDKIYPFSGVSDIVLYDSIINWYKNQNNTQKPFFMLVTTVSTHMPYYDPVTKTYSFDKTLEKADNDINLFVKKLKQAGYFNNGILVITGDHRAMRSISQKEYNKFGQMAVGRIPLIIIDGKNKKEITSNFSHTDLGKSLEYLTLDKVCFNEFQYNIFKDEKKEKCTLYNGYTDRSYVYVKCGNNNGLVQLDGDNTRFVEGKNIDKTIQNKIIDYINYIRINN